MSATTKNWFHYYYFEEMKKFKKLVRSKILQYKKGALRGLGIVILILVLISMLLYKSRTSERNFENIVHYWGDGEYKRRLLLKRAAYKNTVLATTSNFMYREQLRNFQCSLNRLHLPYYPVVFSLDKNTHDFAINHSFASILLSDEEGDDVRPGMFERSGTRSFGNITRNKFDAVLSALNSGLNVVMSDADIHWCSDALSVLRDMSVKDPSLDIIIMPEPEYKTLNSGFYYVRANERTKHIFTTMKMNAEFGNHDQDILNAVLCSKEFGSERIKASESTIPYYCVTKNKSIVRVLESNRWPSGGQIVEGRPIFSNTRAHLKQMCDTRKIFVVHNNFVPAKKKKARMIVKGMWFLESEDNMVCLNESLPSSQKYARTCGIYCPELKISEEKSVSLKFIERKGNAYLEKPTEKQNDPDLFSKANYKTVEKYEEKNSRENNFASVMNKSLSDSKIDTILSKSSYKRSVLVTTSNFMYRAHLRNFQCSLRRLGLPYSPVVFALDKKTHAFSVLNGMNSILISSEEGSDVGIGQFEKRGPMSFGTITRNKLFAVYKVLKSGFDVLMSDADVHWCGDAISIIQNLEGDFRKADVIIMPEMDYKMLNSGFYYVRANEKTLRLFDMVLRNSEIGNHDQDVLNQVFCGSQFGSKKTYITNESGLFYCTTKSGAIVRLLNANLWPSGGQIIDGIPVFSHTRSRLGRMCSKQRFYVVHNNYISASRKEYRMIVKGMWFVSENDKMNCLNIPVPVTKKARSRCSSSCIEKSVVLEKDVTLKEQEIRILENASFDNAILITSANYMYKTHLRNFQCGLHRLSLPYAPIVFSQDKRIHQYSISNGLKSILMSSEIGEDTAPGNFTKSGIRSFSHITRLKFQAVRFALESNRSVLFSDSDIHWCADVIKELKNLGDPYKNADIIVMPEAQYSRLNSGFYLVRSNFRTKELFERMMNAADFGNHDQDVFNAFLCDEKFGAKKIENDDGHIPFYCKTKNDAIVRVLSAEVWPSGNEIINNIPIFKNTRRLLAEMCKSRMFKVVHNNYIKAKLKESRMIVKGMWFISNNHEMSCTIKPVLHTKRARKVCGKYC